VVKTVHQAHTGKLSIARLWHGKIADGATIAGTRLAGLYQVMGQDTEKLAQAGEGDLVALGRLDEVATGDLLTEAGRVAEPAMEWPEVLPPVFSLAVTPLNRADEV
jgi:elongation factor G